MESELLRYLVQNAGHPVSRKAILENVWDLQEDTDTRAIDNFIVRLRKYIEDEPSDPRHLVTVTRARLQIHSLPGQKNKKISRGENFVSLLTQGVVAPASRR